MIPSQQNAKVKLVVLRLLIREAAEIATAEEIHRFYGDQPAPLPDGVTPATQEELDAADAEQW